MKLHADTAVSPVYKVEGPDGRRHVVYNASAIGNPIGHSADKWYVRPYPARTPLDNNMSDPFDSAEEAERSIRRGPGRSSVRCRKHDEPRRSRVAAWRGR